MKSTIALICAFTFCAIVFSCRAAEEPLIPAPLNALLLKITIGMTREETKQILVEVYPKLVQQDGPWSGRGGWLGFGLDERYRVIFSANLNDVNQAVISGTPPSISIFDNMKKVRFDISGFNWGKASGDKAQAE